MALANIGWLFLLYLGPAALGALRKLGQTLRRCSQEHLCSVIILFACATRLKSALYLVSYTVYVFTARVPSLLKCARTKGYYGGQTMQEQKLSSSYWRDGCFAEFARFPAENVHPLDEMSLERNGVAPNQLCELVSIIPAMGAANVIGTTAGETVLVLPATVFFSSTAIVAALALGVIVVAGSRSREKLKTLVKHFGEDGKPITPVVLTGDVHADAAALHAATPGRRGADAYIDYSPPYAAGTTHFEAGFLALQRYGRYVYIPRKQNS
jgi:NADPH:quinone reductase-like Zn-dependent oxidoreductase